MPYAYATDEDIQSQINSIVNANPPKSFGPVPDTSDGADNRYSLEEITEARRKAAWRILDAIGSDPSHPYWGDLSDVVTVTYGQEIPPCYGEIGVPQVQEFSAPGSYYETVRTISGVQLSGGSPTASLTGTDTFRDSDAGLRFAFTGMGFGPTVTIASVDDETTATLDTNADKAYTDETVTLSLQVASGEWVDAMEADADEIDSYVRDYRGAYSDFYGMGRQFHDYLNEGRVPSPLAGKYSTANGIIRFTGTACRIPMIKVPATLAEAQVLADTKIPLGLSATCVRLAIGMLIKEGDNLARLAGIYNLQGENDLLSIRQGSVQSRGIDVSRAIQVAQRYA